MTRPPLVLLVHRIPYPPNKGDKIRSFHLLRHLARRYEVHLGAFVDDAADWRHAPALDAHCASRFLVPLRGPWARLRALSGFATGEPLTVPFYRSRAMARWVRTTLEATGARHLVAFSAAMAQFAAKASADCVRILDLVDVDSDKWRQYAERRTGAAAWIYRREARRLLAYERRCAASFDRTLLVSPAEARLFTELAPEAADRVKAVGNGVDTEYFRPRVAGLSPYPNGCEPLVFTGAMDYWANVDAVTWFAQSVLPAIRARHPEAEFYVVGARPTEAVRQLASLPGVRVTGGVHDIRPYLAHARLAVAPLRIARGVQNKVLEAFAMARPVVATGAALDGLGLPEDYPLVGESAEDLAELVNGVLRDGPYPGLGDWLRAWVVGHYDWERQLMAFDDLLDGGEAGVTEPLAAQPAMR